MQYTKSEEQTLSFLFSIRKYFHKQLLNYNPQGWILTNYLHFTWKMRSFEIIHILRLHVILQVETAISHCFRVVHNAARVPVKFVILHIMLPRRLSKDETLL